MEVVNSIVRTYCLHLIKQPINLLLLSIHFFLLGIFSNILVYDFLISQSESKSDLSISGAIFYPFFGLVFFSSLVFLPLINLQLRPARFGNGLERFFSSYPNSHRLLATSDYLTSTVFSLFYIFSSLVITVPLIFTQTIDWPVFFTAFISTTVLVMLVNSLFHQVCITRPIVSLLLQYSIIVFFWLALILSPDFDSLLFFQVLNLFQLFQQLVSGSVPLGAAIGVLFLYLAIFVYSIPYFFSTRLKKLVAILFLIIAVVTPNIVLNGVDATSNHRFSLLPELSDQLSIEDNLVIKTQGLDQYAKQEIKFRLEQPIRSVLGKKLKLEHQDSEGDFIAPGIQVLINEQTSFIQYPFSKHPQQILAERLSYINRLNSNWVLFLQGHGEPSVLDKSPSGVSEFMALLKSNAHNVQQMSLLDLAEVPDNVHLVVLANAQENWLPDEKQKLLNYLDNGGAFLWLRDPDDKHLEWLEDYFGTAKLSGTIVDPEGYAAGTPHPAILLLRQFQQHPITQSLDALVALPWSSALVNIKSTNSWQTNNLLLTNQQTWVETNIDAEQLQLDIEMGELQGQFVVARVATRQQINGLQKVAIFGDSHFVTNSAIANYSNQDLALNTVAWITEQPFTETIISRPIDRQINLSAALNIWFSWIAPFVVPFLILLASIWVWRKNKV